MPNPESSSPQQPDAFPALLAQSQDAASHGNLEAAGHHARKAAAVSGDEPVRRALAAIALAKSGQSLLAHRMISSLEHAALPRGRDAEESIAVALHALKCHQSALTHARLAGPASGNPFDAYFQATLALYCGHADEAEHLLEACLHMAPDMAGAHWTLAKIRRQTLERNHVDRLRRHIRARRGDDAALPYLCFALFKELDDIGETGEAWQALVHGCLAWRRSVRYDIDHELACMNGLATAFPRAPAASIRPGVHEGGRQIFIVGLPRSGTTLIERILAGHPQVHAGGELDDLHAAMVMAARGMHFDMPNAADAARIAAADQTAIARQYVQNTAWRAGDNRVLTDKRPNNFHYIGAIARALPQARIIHVHKNPMNGCFSLLKEFFGGRYNYSYRLNELAAYHRGYRQLMQHWRESGHEFLDVSYERLVSEPETESRRIVAYCGLDWQQGCLRTERPDGVIASASVAQARAPITRDYVDGWRAYASRLETLGEFLAS